MINSRLGPVLRYNLEYVAWSCLYVFGISAAIMLIANFGRVVIPENIYVEGSFFNFAAIGVVLYFILGIAGVREDLRFLLQHGMGRKTTFYGNLFCSLIAGIVLALFCMIVELAARNWAGFPAAGSIFPYHGFFVGWLSHIASFFFAWQFGIILSLIYYRLNKIQQIAFSVVGIAIIMALSAFGIRSLVVNIADFEEAIRRLVDNPPEIMMPAVLVLGGLGIVAAFGNYLLLRRAQVREG